MANVEIIESKETENLMKDDKAFLLLIKIGYKTVLSEVFDIPPVHIGWAFLSGAESVGNSLPKEYFTACTAQLCGWLALRYDCYQWLYLYNKRGFVIKSVKKFNI